MSMLLAPLFAPPFGFLPLYWLHGGAGSTHSSFHLSVVRCDCRLIHGCRIIHWGEIPKKELLKVITKFIFFSTWVVIICPLRMTLWVTHFQSSKHILQTPQLLSGRRFFVEILPFPCHVNLCFLTKQRKIVTTNTDFRLLPQRPPSGIFLGSLESYSVGGVSRNIQNLQDTNVLLAAGTCGIEEVPAVGKGMPLGRGERRRAWGMIQMIGLWGPCLGTHRQSECWECLSRTCVRTRIRPYLGPTWSTSDASMSKQWGAQGHYVEELSTQQ